MPRPAVGTRQSKRGRASEPEVGEGSQGPTVPPVPEYPTVVFADFKQREAFVELQKRRMKATRYIDTTILEDLKVETDETFLCLLDLGLLYDAAAKTVQFRLMNTSFILTMDLFATHLGLTRPEKGALMDIPTECGASSYMPYVTVHMARGGGRQRGCYSEGGSSSREQEEDVDRSTTEVSEEEEEEVGVPRHTDGRMILDPNGLWFRSQTVVRGVTNSTQENMTHGVTCWSNASDEDKEMWFNNFRRVFYWPTDLERLVWQRYNDIGKKRLRDNMYKVSKRKKAPSFMKGRQEVEPTHYGGSQSFHDRVVLDTKKNKGKVPTIVDLFVDTHAKKTSKGKLIFAKEKDQQLYEQFLVRRKNNPEIDDNELWFDLVEGFQRGDVYGAGSAKEIFYPPTRRKGSISSQQQPYTPSIVSVLQAQLAARERQDAERERRDAERDDEIRRMKEEMERMNSFFANCNTGWRPQPKDPRDPNYGGGSGAGASFPVM
ncbi:uncharacterized protein LOC141657439 [Silene latifolia]|uniref:uncharacterized protein LOC141657439 n=1 Tax=Silene latifolia TaxID=37657 RepID=UPI003D77BB42